MRYPLNIIVAGLTGAAVAAIGMVCYVELWIR